MKKIKLLLSLIILILSLSACVDQSAGDNNAQSKKIQNPRIVASSVSTVQILEKLDLDLIGVPESTLYEMPERYKDSTKVGMTMSPDIEIIKGLNPDYVFGPVSLISDLLPKYEAAKINYGFLNLNNLDGMYKSIEDLGKLLDREAQANALVKDYEDYIANYKAEIKDKPKKKVLILMGLPGSYIIATEHSYVGSLLEMAGAENVYAGTNEQFLNVNTEDIIKKNPDMIFRTAHAMPDEVMQMFKDDFEKNDIWKHFDCVKKGEVYDLDHTKFGMSANFNYKEALEHLKEVLYE